MRLWCKPRRHPRKRSTRWMLLSHTARYPLRYVDRPLTLPNHTIRLDGAIRLDHTDDVDGALVLGGGAISFAKFVELGISPNRLGAFTGSSVEGALPLKLFSKVDLGALPIYARFRALERDKVDVAVDVFSSIPLESSPDVTIGGRGDPPCTGAGSADSRHWGRTACFCWPMTRSSRLRFHSSPRCR